MRRWMTTLLLALCTTAASAAACATRADVPPERPLSPPREVPFTTKAVADAQARLKAKLAAEFPADQIVTRQEDGPFGTVVAVAAFPQAYPGTGVLRVPIDPATGIGYGEHGERSFADFVRERGFVGGGADAETLTRFMNTALWSGMAILDGAATLTRADGKLTLSVVRRFMPSHAGETVTVVVGASGRETVTRTPLK